MNTADLTAGSDAAARAAWDRAAREAELASAAAVDQMLEALRPRPRRFAFLARLFRSSAPSEAEIATRLLSSWSLGKSGDADEVLVGHAVATARLLLSLTEG